MAAAITSIGVVTAHGLGCERLVQAVLHGRCAISPLTRFSIEGLNSVLAAQAPSDDALIQAAAASATSDQPAPDRTTRLLRAAAAEALRGTARMASARCGVSVGTTKGAFELFPSRLDVLGLPGERLGREVGARGPVLTWSAACASSTVALGEALGLIEDGRCDQLLVAGVEALHPFIFHGFHALKALSPTPAAPFDLNRAGLTLGEAAVVLVLESEAHASNTGRNTIATLEGFGTSADAYEQAAPEPSGRGLLLACQRALTHAGLGAEKVDRYHAHGTATRYNDRMEAEMHVALFGGRPVAVCSIKGSVGHTLGAAGLLDVAVCALTMQKGMRPPVTGFRTPDPQAPIPAVRNTAQPAEDSVALVGSAGFGGINAAVVLRKAGAQWRA